MENNAKTAKLTKRRDMREQDKEKAKTNGKNVRRTSKRGLKLESTVKVERSEDRNNSETEGRQKNMLLVSQPKKST